MTKKPHNPTNDIPESARLAITPTPTPVVVEVQPTQASILPPIFVRRVSHFALVAAAGLSAGSNPRPSSNPPQVAAAGGNGGTAGQAGEAGSAGVENSAGQANAKLEQDCTAFLGQFTRKSEDICVSGPSDDRNMKDWEGAVGPKQQYCGVDLAENSVNSIGKVIINGKITVSAANPSVVTMHNGQLCLSFKNNQGVLHIQPQDGELDTMLKTEDGAAVAEIQTNLDAAGTASRDLVISVIRGNLKIEQAGRADSILVQKGERMVLPLRFTGAGAIKEVACSFTLQDGENGNSLLVLFGVSLALVRIKRRSSP